MGSHVRALKDRTFFRPVRVDEQTDTITWPNGIDLDPDVLHGDYPPERPGQHDLDQRAVGWKIHPCPAFRCGLACD